jgi:phosphoglycolate phosphatase
VSTARAAGVVCWAVPYGYNLGKPIADAMPDRIVPDIREVPAFFRA